jgi:hypothetical protein
MSSEEKERCRRRMVALVERLLLEGLPLWFRSFA